MQAKVGDARLKLTDEEQVWRQEISVQREPNKDKRLPRFGVKGMCRATTVLKYTSYNNLFVVPTYHMLTYGVLKRSWTEFLAGSNNIISKHDRGVMASRASGMKKTNDQKQDYSCITVNSKNWQINEWIGWADVYATFIL